tara:strand:+ start:3529 stop:4800 length:1272 start_codon:yes stop_codon:yes gene_type:complete
MEYAEPKYNGEPSVEALANGLATLGRYGDSYMVHAAEGETVVPREVLDANPGLKNQLLWQMKMMGIENPNRYVVGSEFNSINPVTGQPEFFFKKIFKAVKKVFKKVLPVAAPIIGNMIAPGIGGPIASALSAKLTGGSWGDAFKQAALAYGAQTLGSGIMGAVNAPTGQGSAGFFEGLKTGAMAPITAAGNLFSAGPTNPLQQGIFGNVNQGTRGFNTETLFPRYDAQGGTQALYDVKANPPFGTVQPSDGNLAQASGPAAASGAGSGPFTSDLMGKAASALIPGALAFAMSPEEEAAIERLPIGDPRRSAYDQWKKLTDEEKRLPENQQLLREAGISPSYTADRLATITGLTPAQAQEHQLSRFGRIYSAGGGMVHGPGTGTSDSIPAMLSDGEFVFTERAVDGAGGPGRMYELMRQFERAV